MGPEIVERGPWKIENITSAAFSYVLGIFWREKNRKKYILGEGGGLPPISNDYPDWSPGMDNILP